MGKNGCSRQTGIVLYVAFVAFLSFMRLWPGVIFFAIVGLVIFVPSGIKKRIFKEAIRMFEESISRELPKWLRLLNISALLPICFWPGVLLASLMMFDAPGSEDVLYLYLIAIAMLAYPIYLFLLAYYNTKFFQKKKTFGYVCLSFICSILATLEVCIIVWYVIDIIGLLIGVFLNPDVF